MLLLALLACRAEIAGAVVNDAGAPVVGARLVATGAGATSCEAVTDAAGRFRTRCERGAWTFAVTHPDHLPATWTVEGNAGEVDAGLHTLVAIPATAGAWLSDGARFHALRGAQLRRIAGEGTQAWCVGASDTPTVVGPGARLLRNEPPPGEVPADAERWRLYRVTTETPVTNAAAAAQPSAGSPDGATTPDGTGGGVAEGGARPPSAPKASEAPSPAPIAATPPSSAAGAPERCAYRLRKGSAEHWEFSAERVALEGEGAARLWTDLGALPPGDYVLAPWVAGMFIREDVTTDTWRGVWLRVDPTATGPTAP